MPVGIGSTQITGISVVANSTDAASKGYVDTATSSGGVPSIVGQENEFLFSDGTNASWESIGAYQEYITAGNYTFTVPTQASQLFIEATGAGGGGGIGTTTVTSYVNRGEFWFLRTSGTVNSFIGNGNVGNPIGSYGLGYYVMGTASGTIHASTDSITWVSRTSGFGTSNIWSVNYGSNIFLCTGSSAIRTSTDTIHWILRTSGSGSNIITSISTDNNFHLYSAENGEVRSSTDGITWNTRTTPTQGLFSMYARAYASSPSTNYVFAGNTGVVASTDGIIWQLRTSGLGSVTFYCGTYGNGIYLLGTGGGSLIASTDTIAWSSRNYPSGSSNQISDVFFANNTYIVNQYNNRYLITSTNSIVWIVRTSPSTSLNYRAGIFGNSILVYGSGSGHIITSYIPSGFSGSGGGGGASVGWNISKSQISGSSLTVNVGSGGTSNTAGAASTVSWTSPSGTFSVTANGGSAGVNIATNNIIPGGAGGTITGSNNYVYATAGTAGGNGGYFESSTVNRQGLAGSDATNATLSYQTTGGGGGTSADITGEFGKFGGTMNYYGNTLQNSKISSALMNGSSSVPFSGLSYGAGGNGGGAQFGATAWALRTSGFGATAYTLGYGNGLYIMAGNSGRLSTSTDTIVWVLRTSGFGTSTILGYTYGNDTHVLYSQVGIIRASTNGIFWETRTSSTTNNLGNAGNTYPGSIYADGLHVTTGSNGTFLISTDSVIWTLRTTGFGTNTGWATTYGNSVYLLSSGSGQLRTSTDNITWTLRTTGTTSGVNSIQYLNPNYYYFTNGGTIFSSTDSIVWISRASGLNALYASAVSNNSIITGGGTGSIYSSVNGLTWILRTSNVGNIDAFAHTFGNNLFLGVYGLSAQLIVADSAFIGNGGNGFRGGGGGGGGYNIQSNTIGSGGTGGDGYVRISWQ